MVGLVGRPLCVPSRRSDRFKLRSGNRHGASGTWNGSGDPADPTNHHAGEVAFQTPLGLDRAPIDDIIDAAPAEYVTVRDESYVDVDWASGYTKVVCPPDISSPGTA